MGYDVENTISFVNELDKVLRKNTLDVVVDMHCRNPKEFGFEDAFFYVWTKHVDDMLNFIVEQVDVVEKPLYLDILDFYQYVLWLLDLFPEWLISDEFVCLIQNELYFRFYQQFCFFVDDNNAILLRQSCNHNL